MRLLVTSRIMPRTTINLDSSVLAELRERAGAAGKSMGAVGSELLAQALAQTAEPAAERPKLRLITRRMGTPKVDLEDKDALWAILDGED